MVGHEGHLDAPTAVRQADVLNSGLRTFLTPRHQGPMGRMFSFVASDNPRVMVKALKRAEVSDEYVVRVYETAGKGTEKALISFAGTIVKAVEADGTERTIKAAEHTDHALQVEIGAYSVKTYKVVLDGRKVGEKATMPLRELPFDRHCFSYNAFRGEADFEGGYSYAAELLPDEGITVDGVPFCFGEKDAANGMTCRGQVLTLPAAKKQRQLHLLVASDSEDRQATFQVGKDRPTVTVPYYTGFIGQWGHDGQTTGYLKDGEVAWVGSHRHSPVADEPYEFTYMFRVILDIPERVTEVTMPEDEHVVVFAATVVDKEAEVTPAGPFFKTSLLPAEQRLSEAEALQNEPNLLKGAEIVGVSGEVNGDERAANLVDGDELTKWCDAQAAPNYVVFDLGKSVEVKRWRMVNAACEQASYVTRTCLLQGRNNTTEEWRTLDMFDGNRKNVVDRQFNPAAVRYVRLFVVGPTQDLDPAARIYELGVY